MLIFFNQFVFTGMMSTKSNLESRIPAAMDTWIKDMDSQMKIEVFVSNNGTPDLHRVSRQEFFHNGVRIGLVQLPGVTDYEYPPNKKFFSMIKYMHDMYINKYVDQI